MLKIKDNINLKELEKYGFEFDISSGFYERKIDNNWWNKICIDDEKEIFEITEEIGYWTTTFSDDEFFDIKNINDLIEANLVDEVDRDVSIFQAEVYVND